MAKKKGFGVSPITNTIYYGTQDTEKHMWVGQKIDVTDDAIAAVYEWLWKTLKVRKKNIRLHILAQRLN